MVLGRHVLPSESLVSNACRQRKKCGSDDLAATEWQGPRRLEIRIFDVEEDGTPADSPAARAQRWQRYFLSIEAAHLTTAAELYQAADNDHSIVWNAVWELSILVF